MVARPLALFGISYLLALLAAIYQPPLLWAAGVFLAGMFLLRTVRGGQRDYFVIVLAGGAAALLAFAAWQRLALGPVQARLNQTGTALVTAREVSDTGEDGFVRAVLQVEQWQGQKANFRIYAERCPEMSPYEQAELQLTLQQPEKEDRNTYYAKGAYAAAVYEGGYAYRGESHGSSALFYRLRMRLSHVLRRYLSPGNGAAAAAMVVGDRSHLDRAFQRLMSRAGISHLLVVSGLHVTMLCGLLNRPDSRRRRARALASMAIALFMMALTGFTASVTRAGITAILCYTAAMLIQRADGLTNMAVSGVLICLANPFRLCDIGMQLSFAAALGMVWCDEIAERLDWQGYEWLEQKPESVFRRAVRWAAKKLAIPLMGAGLASVCVVPVLLMHGMAVSGAGILGNLLTMWMVPYILLLGFCVIAAGMLPPLLPIYRGFSLLLELLLRLLRAAAGACAALPFSRLPLPQSYTCLVLAVLAALVWLAWYRMRWRWLAAVIPLALALALGLGAVFQKDVVELTLVGNRAAPCLVVTQNAHSAVLFRGGESNRRSVENYLDNHGLPRPDLAVDLRLQPGNAKLPQAKQSLVLAETESGQIPIWPGVCLQTLVEKQGALAAVDIAGWQLAVSTGKPQLRGPVTLDVFAAGAAVPSGILPDTVLTKSTKFKFETANNAVVYWGSYSPAVRVRPGKSVTLTGGEIVYGAE